MYHLCNPKRQQTIILTGPDGKPAPVINVTREKDVITMYILGKDDKPISYTIDINVVSEDNREWLERVRPSSIN